MSNSVRIDVVRVHEYSLPTIGRTKSASARPRNLIFQVDGTHNDSTVIGWGEATPRDSATTGDLREGLWSFLEEACNNVRGATFSLSSREEVLDAVRKTMAQLQGVALGSATGENQHRSFRGSLAGLECALLDVIARALACTAVELLGEQRKEIHVTASKVTPRRADRQATARRIRKQAERFEVTRIASDGALSVDLDLLELVAQTNRSLGDDRPIWLVVSRGYDGAALLSLAGQTADLMRAGRLPAHVVLEPRLRGLTCDQVGRMQRRADRLLRKWRGGRGKRLSIASGSSVWDEDDVERLWRSGGCRIVNIAPQRTGGILRSLDVAQAALLRDRDVEICVESEQSTSHIGAWATKTLAMALPRLDYYTAVPPRNEAAAIGSPKLRYRDAGSNVLIGQDECGFGVKLSRETLGFFVKQTLRSPEAAIAGKAATASYERANIFAAPQLELFEKNPRDSHLVEHEALAHGLETMRVGSLIFAAWMPGSARRIGFYRTSGDANSRVAVFATSNKEMTRRLLRRDGVAFPEGAQFKVGDREMAVEYARILGWPVVVKPLAAAGGEGVTANIGTETQFRWAVDSLRKTNDFVVERHVDGEDYRFLVLGDKVISVLYCRRAEVVGDGASTVLELVQEKNELRQLRHRLQGRPIRFGNRARFELERQGLRWDSIPEAGTRVTLSTNGNVGLGGDTVQVLDETHPSLLDEAIRAVKAIPGLYYGGVDFLIEDHRRPLAGQSAAVCEVNSSPVNGGHHFPMFGETRNVTRELFLAHCDKAGFSVGEARQELCLHLEVRGRVRGVGYRRWMSQTANQLKLSGWVRNGNSGDVVEACVAGQTAGVTALASLAIQGPKNARVDSVRSRHDDGPRPSGSFEVVG